MSAKAEKARRQVIGKFARRAERDFEQVVRAHRAREAELPIVRLDSRRRVFVWVALVLFALAIGLSVLSAVFEVR